MEVLKVRISGIGLARQGMAAIPTKRATHPHPAKTAISAFHDALLAVAKGDITPEQAREFFWKGAEIEEARFFGDVVEFEKKPEEPANG